MIGPVPVDENHEAERLRALAQGAAAQLREWAPGIVIINTSADRGIMNRCCYIADSMGEPWASELAMVVLVADTYSGFVIKLIPGPRFKSVPRFLRVRTCAKGHLHVGCFGVRKDCDLDDRSHDYSAYCYPGGGHFKVNA